MLCKSSSQRWAHVLFSSAALALKAFSSSHFLWVHQKWFLMSELQNVNLFTWSKTLKPDFTPRKTHKLPQFWHLDNSIKSGILPIFLLHEISSVRRWSFHMWKLQLHSGMTETQGSLGIPLDSVGYFGVFGIFLRIFSWS